MRPSRGRSLVTADAEPTIVAALWRGLDVFRPIAWLYAVYSAAVRHQEMARPWLAWTVLGVLGAWTLGSLLNRSRSHGMKVISLELGLACCAILSTRLVDTPQVILGGARTLPGLWPAAAVVAWAVLKGWRGGMLAAFLVGLADLFEVGVATQNTINNIVILVLLGGCIGYCANLSRDGHAALSEAVRLRAQAGERDRLARTVHDGVLQTLSYIHRRSLDLGGEARELGAMAADQERLLRALVSNVSGSPATGGPNLAAGSRADVDLRSVLSRFADGTVSVVPPAGPVLMNALVAQELAAAVGAALDNVRCHAGADARAWVLIQDQGTDVTVTIRDDGVGVTADRLAEAAASSRMGVVSSIGGRMSDLGGTFTLDSRPGTGTMVELSVGKKGPVS